MPAARLRSLSLITIVLVASAGLAVLAQAPASAPAPAAMTAADYARAEKFLAQHVNPLVSGGSVAANRLPGDRFWYRSTAGDQHWQEF